MSPIFPFLFFVALPQKPTVQSWKPELSTDRRAALERISPDSLKGNLSFLASDALEGRATPSPGLTIAAEFIASQFRKAGLEPGVKTETGSSYFQTTMMKGRGSDEEKPVSNVIGVLRGSDETLKDSYIIVTAHYDHIGTNPNLPGDDKIFNGANDDGSGTVGVIELAQALSTLKKRPKRSIVFMTFFGEERGLLGSRHYGKNPVFPLEKTIAHINLEQIGRTDDKEGPRVSAASMTGFDFSDIGPIFAAAGKAVGVAISKHPQNSDAFFGRSDNQALADLGVPAHTLCVAYVYPDYHGVGDHWEKVDYPNTAKVLKAVALGLLTLAESKDEPRWNAQNEKAARYQKAWQERQK
ncbi:M28 family peptidase [Armatimonas sp.]|uniref:M28 family peptidase n=1 Tax=Armatimonas sp. TaxID=1872638 RepID=UPI00286C996C|nr:M28 family peptidase [Armatimonas sp.]